MTKVDPYVPIDECGSGRALGLRQTVTTAGVKRGLGVACDLDKSFLLKHG